MRRRAVANVWYFFIGIAVVAAIALIFISMVSPIQYPLQKGMKQHQVFSGYISAEETREYMAEAARQTTFYALRELGINENECNFSESNLRENFEPEFNLGFGDYVIAYPLEDQYSDMLIPDYYNFTFNDPGDEWGDSLSKLEAISDEELNIIGVSAGDIQVLNKRNLLAYALNGHFNITVSCEEYKTWLDLREGKISLV